MNIVIKRLAAGAAAFLLSLSAFANHAPIDTQIAKNILTAGAGPEVVRHSTIKVNYTGWLSDGTKFDSNLDRGADPFEFQVGAGRVIPGWDMGLIGARQGERFEITIPPELAYGPRGAGNVIPPNATLKFEIEVLDVEPPAYQNIDNASLQDMLDQGVKIFDIRRPQEWRETGVVEGSILLTAFNEQGGLVPGFAAGLASQVSPGEKFILICRTGNRTSVIADALTRQAGYEQVYNVTDGIVHWIADKRPVAKP